MSKAEIGKNQLQALIIMGLCVNHDSAAATWNTLKKCEIYQNLNEVSLQIYDGNFCYVRRILKKVGRIKTVGCYITN